MKFRILVLGMVGCALACGELWSQEPSHLTSVAVRGTASGSGNTGTGMPNKGGWRFVVSGDTRNCGDLIMPAMAQGAAHDQAAFYWHLGDFRAIYEYDEDILARKSMDFGEYTRTAGTIFSKCKWRPSKAAHLAVFLGIGNHETIPPKSRGEYVARFAEWLDSPMLRDQRLADDPSASQPQSNCHWDQGGVDLYLSG